MEFRSTYGSGGGPDKTILLSAEKHDLQRFNVIVIYLRGESDSEFKIAKWALKKRIQFIEVKEKGIIDFKSILELNRIVKQYKIDIIHAHDYKTDIIAYLLSKVNRSVKLLSTAHGWTLEGSKIAFYNWLNIFILRFFENIIAVSEATKKLMVKSGIDKRKITVIHNSIDIETWKKREEDGNLRKDLGLDEDIPVVGQSDDLVLKKIYAPFWKLLKKY